MRYIFQILLLTIAASSLCYSQGEEYLPVTINGWKAVDSIQKYSGDDLFILIDGGADIFYEYGFVDVVTQKYASNEDIISVEIYVMTDSDAAYGIYSLKTVGNPKTIELGNAASGSDDYIMLWKGKYFITFSVYNSDKTSREGLIEIAQEVNKSILDNAKPPAIMDMFKIDDSINHNLVFIKGNMGLYNLYYFDSENIFGVKEGAAGNFNNTENFIFKYDSPEEAGKWFSNGINKIKASTKYRKVKTSNNGNMFSKQEDFILLDSMGRYVIISISESKSKTIESNIKLKDFIEANQ